MKKISTVFILFIIICFSGCNMKNNIALNGKDLHISKLEILKATKVVSQHSDTSNREQLTGDFRYDYLFK